MKLRLVLLIALPFLVSAVNPSQRSGRRSLLKGLSPSQHEHLKQNFEEFDKLPDEEKQQLRYLHDSIADREELEETMNHFLLWLDTLTTAERKGLEEAPNPQERFEKVNKLIEARAERLKGAFEEYKENLKYSPPDGYRLGPGRRGPRSAEQVGESKDWFSEKITEQFGLFLKEKVEEFIGKQLTDQEKSLPQPSRNLPEEAEQAGEGKDRFAKGRNGQSRLFAERFRFVVKEKLEELAGKPLTDQEKSLLQLSPNLPVEARIRLISILAAKYEISLPVNLIRILESAYAGPEGESHRKQFGTDDFRKLSSVQRRIFLDALIRHFMSPKMHRFREGQREGPFQTPPDARQGPGRRPGPPFRGGMRRGDKNFRPSKRGPGNE